MVLVTGKCYLSALKYCPEFLTKNFFRARKWTLRNEYSRRPQFLSYKAWRRQSGRWSYFKRYWHAHAWLRARNWAAKVSSYCGYNIFRKEATMAKSLPIEVLILWRLGLSLIKKVPEALRALQPVVRLEHISLQMLKGLKQSRGYKSRVYNTVRIPTFYFT